MKHCGTHVTWLRDLWQLAYDFLLTLDSKISDKRIVWHFAGELHKHLARSLDKDFAKTLGIDNSKSIFMGNLEEVFEPTQLFEKMPSRSEEKEEEINFIFIEEFKQILDLKDLFRTPSKKAYDVIWRNKRNMHRALQCFSDLVALSKDPAVLAKDQWPLWQEVFGSCVELYSRLLEGEVALDQEFSFDRRDHMLMLHIIMRVALLFEKDWHELFTDDLFYVSRFSEMDLSLPGVSREPEAPLDLLKKKLSVLQGSLRRLKEKLEILAGSLGALKGRLAGLKESQI